MQGSQVNWIDSALEKCVQCLRIQGTNHIEGVFPKIPMNDFKVYTKAELMAVPRLHEVVGELIPQWHAVNLLRIELGVA